MSMAPLWDKEHLEEAEVAMFDSESDGQFSALAWQLAGVRYCVSTAARQRGSETPQPLTAPRDERHDGQVISQNRLYNTVELDHTS